MMKDTFDECSGMYLSAASAVWMVVLLNGHPNQKGEKEKLKNEY